LNILSNPEIPESKEWISVLKEKGQLSLNIIKLFESRRRNIEDRNCKNLEAQLGNIFDTDDTFFSKSSISLLIDKTTTSNNLRKLAVNNNLTFGKNSIKVSKDKNSEDLNIFFIEKNEFDEDSDKHTLFRWKVL
jgi:hypothetical protein